MRIALIGCLLAARVAAAQPGATDDFEACKVRRRELTAEAMKIADPVERGRQLAAMPTCVRGDDGSTRVIAAPPPPPPETTPFAPHLTAGVRVGAADSAVLIANASAATGLGPFIELDGGWYVKRHLELAAFAGYAQFRDPSWMPGPASATYDVHDQTYDAGVRSRLHYDRVSFGAGLGVEIEHGAAAGFATNTYLLVLGSFEGAYEVARSERFAIDVLGIATYATDPGRLWNQTDRDLVSLRLALGVRFR